MFKCSECDRVFGGSSVALPVQYRQVELTETDVKRNRKTGESFVYVKRVLEWIEPEAEEVLCRICAGDATEDDYVVVCHCHHGRFKTKQEREDSPACSGCERRASRVVYLPRACGNSNSVGTGSAHEEFLAELQEIRDGIHYRVSEYRRKAKLMLSKDVSYRDAYDCVIEYDEIVRMATLKNYLGTADAWERAVFDRVYMRSNRMSSDTVEDLKRYLAKTFPVSANGVSRNVPEIDVCKQTKKGRRGYKTSALRVGVPHWG